MDNSWHAVLRDVIIILATGTLIPVAVFCALIAWQIYRLAREAYEEVKPLIASLRTSVESVEHTASFMADRMVSPASGALSSAAGAWGILQYVRTLKQARAKTAGAPMLNEEAG